MTFNHCSYAPVVYIKENMAKLRNTFLTLSLVLATSFTFLQPAQASVEAKATPEVTVAPVSITAPLATVTFERPTVISTPAPKIEAPVVAVQYTQPEAVTTVSQAAPVAKKTEVVVQASAPVQAAAPSVTVVSSGGGQALLASAYGQLGQIQDCTAMVERALGSIGIISGDIAPQHFFRFGTVVGDPQPGDIVISAGHVGIYSGNGMMISGGFNGNQTVEHPVRYVGAASYVRI